MLSLLHQPSYGSDSSYAAQSSYGTSEELNAVTWGSDSVYPSPPMSSSPSGTFAGQRGFDPYTGRYVHQPPTTAQNSQQWAAHPGSYPGGFPHQQQLHHHHQHQHQHPHPHPHAHQHQVGPAPRSPKTQHGLQYAMPQQQVGQANYAYGGQPQMVRGYPTPERGYQSLAQPAQPTTVLGSSTPGPKSTKQQRRTKPHVVTACYNCKKAHLSCEEQRPCQRCKSSGKTDSCFNVAHKRRGRPRIRDSNTAGKTQKPNSSGGGGPIINTRPAQVKSTIDLGPDSAVSFNGAAHFDARAAEQPRAFLNSDFTILKVNQAFKGHFDYEHDPVGRSLEQLIDSSDKNTLTLLRDSLREERDVRKVSAYLSALKLEGGHDVNEVPAVESLDYTTVTQQNFTQRDSNLRFRFRGNNVQNLTVLLQLAKADQFFVILTLPILQENATATTNMPPTGTFHQPRSMPSVNTSSYALNTSNYAASPSMYSAQSAIAPQQHRLPLSAQSTPGSPYYTLATVPGPVSAAGEPMTPSRSYDQGYYYAGPVYNYTIQAGPPDQAMAAAAEPRQFPAYAPESAAQMQAQYPSGQQMLPQTFQLPPIYAQHQHQQVERPRSVHGPQIAYAIPREQYAPGQLPIMRPMHHTAPVPGPQGSRKHGAQELVQ